MTPTELLALSDERDFHLRRLLAAERDAYERGRADGYAAALDRFAEAIGGRIMPARPTDLDIKRWGPGGREHFADPRPGDYPGQGGGR